MSQHAPHRILIVDDEEKLSRFVSMCLSRIGYETTTCTSAGEARRRLEDEDWTLVLTDLMMPDETGFQLIAWLQEHRPQLPVVVITAHSTQSIQGQVAQARVAGFLNKPFTLKDLYATVEKALAPVDLSG
ncbi:MAG: response regulator [Caldilineae bacterium]|nr:MAG: response regulator [Caldilineae bacterium]